MLVPCHPLSEVITLNHHEGVAAADDFMARLDAQDSYNNLLWQTEWQFDRDSFLSCLGRSAYHAVAGRNGQISIVQGTEGHEDKVTRSETFDYHTDGFDLPLPPALFILACENPGTTNAQTRFVDTKFALQQVAEHLPVLDQLMMTYVTDGLKRYSRPLIETHPVDGLPITNLITRGFIEAAVNLTNLGSLPDYRQIARAMSALYEAIEDSVVYTHAWEAGDVLIADNHTYLHSRVATKPDPDRKLFRIWLDPTEAAAQTVSVSPAAA